MIFYMELQPACVYEEVQYYMYGKVPALFESLFQVF